MTVGGSIEMKELTSLVRSSTGSGGLFEDFHGTESIWTEWTASQDAREDQGSKGDKSVAPWVTAETSLLFDSMAILVIISPGVISLEPSG